METEFDRRYRACQSRDARFDGAFYGAVTSTGIYCRPSCPAITPRRENIRFYLTAAAAQADGFRACLRCRPDVAPGSPDWDARADIGGRAMRLIGDGVVDREGVTGLASRLGYSERQLHRRLVESLGAGPLALARAQRAHSARLLIETTDLPLAQVALAAGFSSVRQFNDTIRAVFARTPSELRRKARRRRRARGAGSASPAGTGLELRLAYREPFDGDALVAFLASRAVSGVEEVVDGTYRRTIRLAHGHGIVALTPTRDGYVSCRLELSDLRDLGSAVQRARRLFDLDADPVAVANMLRADSLLAPLVDERPGLRVPGAVDGGEIAVRAVVGQQVSVAGARTLLGRLVERYGDPIPEPSGSLTHLFSSAAALAGAANTDGFSMPASRRRALGAVCSAIAAGDVDLEPGADPAAARDALVALPGIGEWTAGYVVMRALGDPDAYPVADLVLRKVLASLGADERRFEKWAPWRAYAAVHLWAHASSAQPAALATAA